MITSRRCSGSILYCLRSVSLIKDEKSLFPTGSGVLFHHQMLILGVRLLDATSPGISFASSSGISTPVGTPTLHLFSSRLIAYNPAPIARWMAFARSGSRYGF